MFSVKRSCIVFLICIIIFVTVNSDEDDDKNVKPDELQTVTTENILKNILEDIEDEEGKESVKPENKANEDDSAIDVAPIDEKVKLEEEIEEELKGTEETIKVKLEEKLEEEEAEEVSEKPSEIAKEPVSEESVETPTSASPLLAKETTIEKEEAPEDAFAVWNSKGKVCLLARFNASFTIMYPSKGGEQEAKIHVPYSKANVKGKCESTTRTPLLQISWQKSTLTMMFNKSDEENWVVTSVEFTYDTSDSLFDRATNAGKKTARSKALALFETPVEKSYYCPAQEVVLLYTANKQVVTARFTDIILQPYAIEEGKFSPVRRCNKVVLDGPDETPFVQDETIPLAVGCTLALITLCILIGFSVHRAYNAAKVDYNNME